MNRICCCELNFAVVNSTHAGNTLVHIAQLWATTTTTNTSARWRQIRFSVTTKQQPKTENTTNDKTKNVVNTFFGLPFFLLSYFSPMNHIKTLWMNRLYKMPFTATIMHARSKKKTTYSENYIAYVRLCFAYTSTRRGNKIINTKFERKKKLFALWWLARTKGKRIAVCNWNKKWTLHMDGKREKINVKNWSMIMDNNSWPMNSFDSSVCCRIEFVRASALFECSRLSCLIAHTNMPRVHAFANRHSQWSRSFFYLRKSISCDISVTCLFHFRICFG